MTSDFFLSYGWLILNSFTPEKREEIMQLRLSEIETAKIFESGKNKGIETELNYINM